MIQSLDRSHSVSFNHSAFVTLVDCRGKGTVTFMFLLEAPAVLLLESAHRSLANRQAFATIRPAK